MQIKIAKWSIVKTADLTPAEKNPRIHSEAQLKKIAASIKENGWINPLVIDSDKNILAGNGRYSVAVELGIVKVPVVVADDLTEKQKRIYIIADNRIAIEAQWDYNILRQDFDWLKELGVDLELTGFSLDEITSIQIDDDFFNVI